MRYGFTNFLGPMLFAKGAVPEGNRGFTHYGTHLVIPGRREYKTPVNLAGFHLKCRIKKDHFMSDEKKALRKEVLAWRQNQKEPLLISDEASTMLLDWIQAQGITSVGLYHAMKGEVDVSSLKEVFDRYNISYAYPRVLEDHETMVFQTTSQTTILQKQAFGFYAPEADEALITQPELLLVPGLSFDKQGNRLGFGKGHYDRYLSSHSHIKCIGVCASQQMRECIPAEPHDEPMKHILTEQKLVLL